jgi:hypothetical protein
MTHLPSPPAAKRAPQSPQALAGELRLLATLEALILALLAAFLGRRRTAANWHALSPLDYVNDDEDLPQACLFPGQSLFAPGLRPDYRLPCHTHQGIEHPILYVLGPGPNRGMCPLPSPHPIVRPGTARAPPPKAPPPLARPLPLPQGRPTHVRFVPGSKHQPA